MTTTGGDVRWQPTPAFTRAVVLAGLFALAGVLLGRPDLVLLALPFAVGTAWALRRRPAEPRLALTADQPAVVEGDEVTCGVRIANPGPADHDLVVTRTRTGRWLDLAGADRPHAVTVPPGQEAELVLSGVADRWGRHPVGPVSAAAHAADGLLAAEVGPAAGFLLPVFPETAAFDAAHAVPRAAGLIGAHRTRQHGPGGELAGVRQYAPGDRLRRVDWRVSLRARELHVAATLTERDAEVMLVLDLLTDAGAPGGVRGAASVVDVTVRAAAGIAGHHLRQGDRVSAVEYGHRARRLRPASGRRQQQVLLDWLLDVQAGGADWGEPAPRIFGGQRLAADTLVLVLTPLVDPGTATMLAALARSGRYVVAVDTLPPDQPVPDLGPQTDLAYRLWLLERENTLGALREHGIPVVPWRGPGSLDPVLASLARPRVTGVGR